MRCNGKSFRFLNKNTNISYTGVINKWVKELNSLYGVNVHYYVYKYKKERHDYLYGEDLAAQFSSPIPMTIIAKVNNDSLSLSKFGLQTQAECEMFIPFDTFASAMGDPKAYPKVGDLVRLTEAGLDRPGGGGYPFWYGTSLCSAFSGCGHLTGGDADASICNGLFNSLQTMDNTILSSDCNVPTDWIRGPNIYEITSVIDDNLAQGLNPMLSHTVWNLKAIRFDNSYQPDAPVENGSDMINDSQYYGKLSGGTATPENEKRYPQHSDKENEKYWDYNRYSLDTIYGDYGAKPKSEIVPSITYSASADPYSDQYAVVYDSLPFVTFEEEPEEGTTTFFSVFADSGTIALSSHDEAEEVENAKSRYVLKDQGDCLRSEKIYAVYILDQTIALEYIGGMSSYDYTTETLFNNIYLKDASGNSFARLFVKDGTISLASVETGELLSRTLIYTPMNELTTTSGTLIETGISAIGDLAYFTTLVINDEVSITSAIGSPTTSPSERYLMRNSDIESGFNVFNFMVFGQTIGIQYLGGPEAISNVLCGTLELQSEKTGPIKNLSIIGVDLLLSNPVD